jgi:hypothetical protein
MKFMERRSLSLAFFVMKQAGDNFLTGSIPDDIAPLSDLIVLSLGELRYVAPIMLVLRLSFFVSDHNTPFHTTGANELNGTISTSLGLLTKLSELWLRKYH